MDFCISPLDRKHLKSLEEKLQVVRDRVAGVATGRHTGFFLGGRGGIGKSHAIHTELARRNVPFKFFNSHMTARGLFDCLEAYPDSIHVIEDIESLTRDRLASGVLRSALWGTHLNRDGQCERLVTWNARGTSSEFIFTGGLIMTSNRRIADLPELAALKTRISCEYLEVSDCEIVALMRKTAVGGYSKNNERLDPDECMEIVEFILNEKFRIKGRLDMRLLINSFQDRLQANDLDSGCNWQDLVASRVHNSPSVQGEIAPVGVRQRKQAERLQVAREIVKLPSQERLEKWKHETGASQSTLYRILKKLGENDALDLEI